MDQAEDEIRLLECGDCSLPRGYSARGLGFRQSGFIECDAATNCLANMQSFDPEFEPEITRRDFNGFVCAAAKVPHGANGGSRDSVEISIGGAYMEPIENSRLHQVLVNFITCYY